MKIIYQERIADGGSRIEVVAVRCEAGDRKRVVGEIIGGEYAVDVHGRPMAAGRTISISYAGRIMVVAMRGRGRVGVDVEMMREGDEAEVLPAGLSSRRRETLLAVEGSERGRRFYRLWTAKEALCKALGLGVSLDLAEMEVRVDGGEAEFVSLYGKAELARGWKIVHRELAGEIPMLIAVAWDQRLVGEEK